MIRINTDDSNLSSDLDVRGLLLDEIGVYAFVKDRKGRYVYVNELTRQLFNMEMDEIIGFDDTKFFDFDGVSELSENDRRVIELGESVDKEEVKAIKATGDLRVYRVVKKPIYNNDNEVIGLLGVSTDITDIHDLKEELRKQATTDVLTGLRNRRYFFEVAENHFAEADRHDLQFSIIVIDIDFFKEINDSYGHYVGDRVITVVGNRIAECLRKGDVLARIGGEEFAILLPGTDVNEALWVAERMRAHVSERSVRGEWDGTITPKISLGVTGFENQDNRFLSMYERADNALYAAKNNGRNRVSVSAAG